jgi:hypothetical protein
MPVNSRHARLLFFQIKVWNYNHGQDNISNRLMDIIRAGKRRLK